jgi:hypothetical protein
MLRLFYRLYLSLALNHGQRIVYERTLREGVNVRLLNEQAERDKRIITPEDEVEKQWPSREDCAKCYQEDGSREMLTYERLRIEYWPNDFVTVQYREDLEEGESNGGEADSEEDNGPWKTLWFLTLLIIIGGALAWYTKKLRLDRSGWHKKTDL